MISLIEVGDVVALILQYQLTLLKLVFLKQKYATLYEIFPQDRWARVQIYSQALIFRMWSKPHYRAPSLQQDMINNLQNVAVPGTGIPLSIFCYHWIICLCFLCFINPIVCLMGAINKVRRSNRLTSGKQLVSHFRQHLLHPDDWFSFWRLNCQLVSYHSLLKETEGYKQEDKWTFLKDGKRAGVPVSPYSEVEAIVCKNKNIEGGMGIHFYKNATVGGDWIIQEKLANADWLNDLLPENAPLSTLRIITSSTWSLGKTIHQVDNQSGESDTLNHHQPTTDGRAANRSAGVDSSLSSGREDDEVSSLTSDISEAKKYVRALSAVLRLGRKGASTDHSSILFDCDIAERLEPASASSPSNKRGMLQLGTTNGHWYRLGLSKALDCPWLPPVPSEVHPDAPSRKVTGKYIPSIEEAIDIVVSSHFKMMKDVPMVGWDVAFTTKGICLLEVNLSCNFFRGTFDIPKYINFVESYWQELDNDSKALL